MSKVICPKCGETGTYLEWNSHDMQGHFVYHRPGADGRHYVNYVQAEALEKFVAEERRKQRTLF